MITVEDAQKALDVLRGAGIAGLKDADPNVWALILNAAPMTTTDKHGRQPLHDDNGQVIRLDPQPKEVVAAATRMAALGVKLPQAADLAVAIQDRREGDRELRAARVTKDAQDHGPLIPEGERLDVNRELAWKRAATHAIGAGATREQAIAHAWKTIGMGVPQLPPPITPQAGIEQARRVLKELAAAKRKQNTK